MFKDNFNKKAILALLLLVPVPSLGVATGLYFPGILGFSVALFSKIWMLLVPIVWLVFVESENFHLKVQQTQRRDVLVGLGLGLFMLGIILITYWWLGSQWIDVEYARERARQIGLSNFVIYLIGSGYWVFINSLFEEFVWRWFVYRQCEILVSSPFAVVLSASFFTIHHIVGLAAYFDWRVTTLCSLGVFIAGAIWSWCYLTYRSIWTGYISHVFADIAIFIVGWQLLFS